MTKKPPVQKPKATKSRAQKPTVKEPKPASKGERWTDPLSRPIVAATIPGSGVEEVVQPDAQELVALAKAVDLNEIKSLRAEYRLARRSGGIISVDGRLRAKVVPTCVVTLEPFELVIDEPVNLRFAEPAALERRPSLADHESTDGPEPPDEIENGEIDLGRVTTEFLSLAVPPFPRKPGAELEVSDETAADSPFASLSRLKS